MSKHPKRQLTITAVQTIPGYKTPVYRLAPYSPCTIVEVGECLVDRNLFCCCVKKPMADGERKTFAFIHGDDLAELRKLGLLKKEALCGRP